MAERILVFDSGLGGLSVYDEIVRQRPGADIVYVADDAAFPYGSWPEAALVAHLLALFARLIEEERPSAIVVACNTASTLILPPLRARWPGLPVVGTVPAIKPAAAASTSRLVAVIATPGTVAREYTKGLVDAFAQGCRVVLVGATRLATQVEAVIRGTPVADAEIAAEIAPCFVAEGERRTDVVVLACTHYPLILPRLRALAPWPVLWIDPAPAIARQAVRLLDAAFADTTLMRGAGSRRLRFTSGALPEGALQHALASRGFQTEPGMAVEPTGPLVE